jgi:uncharacterized membrane protein YoaK (UPF0700 family)
MGFVDDSSESSAPVTMAALLAAVAGFLDALNFTGLTGTFVANQTGNTVLLGIAVADGKASQVWPALVAIMSFTVGGTLTVLVMPDQAGRGRWSLLAVEAALLVAFALIAWPAARDQDGRAGGWALGALVAFGAAAMGVQTSAVLRVWNQRVSTTFTSAMLHDAGRLAAEFARRHDQRPWRRRALVAVTAAVVVYAAGAALGTLAAKGASIWLFAPAAVISLVAAAELLRHRRA